MMQTIGIYGGRFNPIHLGHVKKIKDLSELCHFDALYFLPCGEHAFKEKTTMQQEHRLEMLKIALTELPFKIDTQELERLGKSYTIDTMRNYRQQYGHHVSLSFIMGHDAFYDFMRWKEFDSILGLAHIILLSRPYHQCEFNEALSTYLKQHQAYDLKLIQQEASGFIFDVQEKDYPYSSTGIRTAIKSQQKPLGLDPRVDAYIEKYQLYR